MVKAVTFFLIAMLILAMLGKLKLPSLPKPKSRPKPKKTDQIPDARKCPECGSYILGDGECSCQK
jgi:hypothetical protein